MTKKILLICGYNIDRSPTAEDLFKGKEDFEIKSAGTRLGARNAVSKELIDWADTIFAMEQEQMDALILINPRSKGKIIVLDIEDSYKRGDPCLVKILREKLSRYVEM